MERGDGELPAWGFWDPAAGGGAYVTTEAAAGSLSSYGGPSIALASPTCAAFEDRSVVSCGEPSSYWKQQQQQVLTCLKLGKRQYYDGGRDGEEAATGTKRAATMSRGASGPRCQVEGCSKALVDAKDYHKRHKVCEMHSKAPCVVVLGAQQRFCQQCSRFHVLSEFDDAKRSCRRRLAGHNERRRKSSSSESIMRSDPSLESTIMSSRYPYISSNSPGRALSLLSSKATSWVSTPELSSPSSAALRELIAENRAALFAKQLFIDRSGLQSIAQASCSSLCCDPHQHQFPFQVPVQLSNGWNHLHGSGNHVTLDLMQMPASSVEFLPVRNKSKDEEEECCEIWKSFEGTHVL